MFLINCVSVTLSWFMKALKCPRKISTGIAISLEKSMKMKNIDFLLDKEFFPAMLIFVDNLLRT